MRPALVGMALACGLAGGRALAQENDSTSAQALFDDAKKLMQAGHYDEACPKLAESQRLDPGGGTLLALGLCHEAQGKTASAWTDFNLALSAARKDRRPEREATASSHLRALEAKLARLRVVVTPPVPDGFEVRRDGTVLNAPLWGTRVPIDPGDHIFEAHATGKKPWKTTIKVHDSEVLQVEVPPLEDLPVTLPPPVLPTVTPPASSSAPPPPPPLPPPRTVSPESGSSVRTIGFVTGGVGIAAAAVGLGFALSANSLWHTVQTACPADRCTDPVNVTRGQNAGTAADVASVFFVVGGVGIASAIAMILLAPSGESANTARVRLVPMLGAVNGLSLGGSL